MITEKLNNFWLSILTQWWGEIHVRYVRILTEFAQVSFLLVINWVHVLETLPFAFLLVMFILLLLSLISLKL